MLRTWVAASVVFTLLPIFALFPSAAATDQWPQFRGRHAGVALDSPALPDTWSRTQNVVWALDVPGMGWSSPVVWDDVIFITAVVKPGPIELPATGFYGGNVQSSVPKEVHRWMVYAVDFKTGRIRWEREVRRTVPLAVKHEKNTYASETPVTDGEMVYFYFGNTGLYAFDMDGNAKWSRTYEPQNTRYGWGTAASPILYKNRLYLVNDNDEVKAFTGKWVEVAGRPADFRRIFLSPARLQSRNLYRPKRTTTKFRRTSL